jgi:hypothetical protein
MENVTAVEYLHYLNTVPCYSYQEKIECCIQKAQLITVLGMLEKCYAMEAYER